MARARKKSNLAAARARMYHDLVFECAERQFASNGYEATTIQEIAKEAGISLKTLYATFPGKQELYNEIHAVRGRAFVESVAAATAEGRDALDGLRRAVQAHVRFLFEHRDYLRMHLQMRVAWGLGPGPGFGAEFWERGMGDLASVIQRGMDEGVFHRGDAGWWASRPPTD